MSLDNLIFVDFGAFSVYWYGVCIGLALLAALGLSFYCEFRMNASSLVRNYIMMGISLGILILISCYWFFRCVRMRARREDA